MWSVNNTPMPRKRDEAVETSTLELAREMIRAKQLCQREEEECSDAETLEEEDDPDYECSSEDDSYESSFIDDSEEDEEETRQALAMLARQKRRA